MPDRALYDLLDQAIDALLGGADPGVSDVPAGVANTMFGSVLDPLVRIAGVLRGMPEEHFESRLKADLERRTSMPATETAATAVREGFRTVTPLIIVPDGARLVEFLKRTFGAEELTRTPVPGGFHAEVRIGDSMLAIQTGEALRYGERRGAFHIYVPDCDAAFGRALEGGATSVGAPADQHYGERSGWVKDFAGNNWYIATRLDNHYAPPGLGNLLLCVSPRKARVFIDFAKRAFGAEEVYLHENPEGRVVIAGVRIGNAVVEMSDAHDESLDLPSIFLLHVEDCDASYQRAIAAGATGLREPADQADGSRTAVVEDPFGYRWIPDSLTGKDSLRKNTAS
jgi:PhnB protein